MSISVIYGGCHVLTSAASNNITWKWVHGLTRCLLPLVLLRTVDGHLELAAKCKCNVSSRLIEFMPWGIRNNSSRL